MIYPILAIFSDDELEEIKSILLQSVLVSQGVKNQMVQAVEDYHYLVNKLAISKGLSQQVVMFLLDSDSLDSAEVEEFLIALDYWVMILEDEKEQRMYADILRYSYFEMDEILALRSTLLEILVELDGEVTKDTKIPMQLDLKYEEYATWMFNYGSEVEDVNSSFNIVPNLKGKTNGVFYDSFAVYTQDYEVPTL